MPARRGSSPSSPPPRASGSPSTSGAGHAVAYAKGTETIADLLAFLGAQGAALRLGEEAVVAATRARANRLANADHANIVRTSRAADVQLRAIRRLEREGRLDELAPELARDRAPARAPPDALAARARPPLRPAGDEGRGPPPARADPAPRRALGGLGGTGCVVEPPGEVCRAGRRGSSEDDLPLRFDHAPDRGAERGLNPTPDERRPALRRA